METTTTTTNQKAEELKRIVREKYAEIAEGGGDGCCGTACGCSTGTSASIEMAESYQSLHGYVADADLGLGCGLPTEFAQIKSGDVVLDLGSGAGNDVFVARAVAGENGKVIGVDMTSKMVELARVNAAKLGYTNVDFRLGEIEDLPVRENSVDVVISNCVLNLVPDKAKAFSEVYRVLKPGGHFSISDIVIQGTLPEGLKASAEMYAGCVAGAIPKGVYLDVVKESGFSNITVQKEKRITIAEEILDAFLTAQEREAYDKGEIGIFSITLYGEKAGANIPKAAKEKSCCGPECCN